MSQSLKKARKLADEIARAMVYYPMLLRTTPPRLLDVDEVFSKVPNLYVTYVPATNPRDEIG